MRSVLENFVDREETAEGHVGGLERHFAFIRVHHTPLAGVANFWRSNYLQCDE